MIQHDADHFFVLVLFPSQDKGTAFVKGLGKVRVEDTAK